MGVMSVLHNYEIRDINSILWSKKNEVKTYKKCWQVLIKL
jgi:hypothetical protein